MPGAKPGDYFHEDEVRIRDIAADKIISVPLKNHGFGTVLTWEDRVYVFGADVGDYHDQTRLVPIILPKNWAVFLLFFSIETYSFSGFGGTSESHSFLYRY